MIYYILRKKVDGCSSTTGKADKDDWVVSCDAQLPLRADLDLLTRNISP